MQCPGSAKHRHIQSLGFKRPSTDFTADRLDPDGFWILANEIGHLRNGRSTFQNNTLIELIMMIDGKLNLQNESFKLAS